MKFKTNFVFLILVVVYGFKDSHKDTTEPVQNVNY